MVRAVRGVVESVQAARFPEHPASPAASPLAEIRRGGDGPAIAGKKSMSACRIISCAAVLVLASCDDRGDRDEPYAMKPGAFSRPNPGNYVGESDGTPLASGVPGGATSPGVTSGAPSTKAEEGAPSPVPDADPHRSAAGGENSQNAAGATAPGGGSSSTPTPGGPGVPGEKPQEQR